MNGNLKRAFGFTLIELMVVVVIVAIFAAIAIPSYQSFVRRSTAAQAQQEVQRIATLLEHSKSRNFNYIGFNLSPNPTVVPLGATGTSIKYNIDVKDGTDPSKSLSDAAAAGQDYFIRALSTDSKNYSYIFSSTGLRCKKMGTTMGYNCIGAEAW
ncbi:type IV pilin protein [Acinetobacter sp. ANC 3832]|uniref:type IV pilin protein n=1 Tax=Acinetobacter sp. ANC 3832 TaxID=1977874 RepID=UPI000A333216|nr:type IV pilin protein [Acinetobacter sp. ANC 3832]OTG96324.1 pilin [Acinetobacter sp. ANC 3832]